MRFAAAALSGPSAEPLYSRPRLDTAVALLRWIHSQYPQTRAIGIPNDLSLQFRFFEPLSKMLLDSAQRHIQVDRWLDPPRTGILQFDRITDTLGGALGIHLQTLSSDDIFVTVFYRAPVNIVAVARFYAPLRPGIDISPFQGIAFGTADRTEVLAGDSAWTVYLSTGWGDCPAGCIYHHYWTFMYSVPSGRIQLMTDSGPPVPLHPTW